MSANILPLGSTDPSSIIADGGGWIVIPTLTAERGSEPWRRRLHLPAYQIGDVARYAGTAPQTVTYWHYRGGQLGPVLPGRVRRQPLSYLQLVEIAFVATFRALGVPLQRIRRARIYASQVLNSENPFAEYKWLTEGYHVMLDLRDVDSDPKIDRLIVGDSAGQIAWRDMVSERFAQFDYEDGLALVWWVRGRQMPEPLLTKRFGAEPPASLVELLEVSSREVWAACGFNSALFEGSQAAAVRESWRLALFGVLSPLGRLVETELRAKLGDVTLDWSELRASDLSGRARAFQSMVGGGMPVADAVAIAGLMVDD